MFFLQHIYMNECIRGGPSRPLHRDLQWSIVLFLQHKRLLGICHVRWLPCHHGMARPQVAVGGDAHQIRKVAANILYNLSRTADRDDPPVWRLGVGITTPRRKKALLRKITSSLGPGWNLWINDLSERNWI
jgi:hypothetical protein